MAVTAPNWVCNRILQQQGITQPVTAIRYCRTGFDSASKSSKNKNDPINEKTTPMYAIMAIISIANSNDCGNFSSLFLRLLDCRYQIRIYSTVNLRVHCLSVSSPLPLCE